MNERLKEVRKALKLSQKDFGAKLGAGRDVIVNMELDRAELKPLFIEHLCSVFDVNEEWLRTGNGDMFIESDDANIVSVSTEYGLDDLSQIILKAYVSMDAPKRTALNDFVKEMADRVIFAATSGK